MREEREQYEQIELYANADDLRTLWDAAREVEWHKLPALTIRFSNVPVEIAGPLKASLAKRGFDLEEV